MRKALLFLVIVMLTPFALAQSKPGSITAAAVWQPANLATTQAACGKSTGASLETCVTGQMTKAGASPDAVAFTRELYQLNGQVGILSGFNKVGPVDIAFVTYLFQANPSHGLLLVNGQPPILNVEDLKLLDQNGLQQSFQFQDLKNQFPQVALFPGDRDGKTWPNSQTGSNGGLQFVIGYPLRNGCPTCAHAGFALFQWNFDPSGKFTGTTFMGMTPAPVN
ncbi:MAG: hypothetical protein WCC87_08455 [Candidatus Korobacteraceae bacterium]